MQDPDDILILRARDFWTSVLLFLLSVFFLFRTAKIPLFGENRAGVSGSDWYNSAAIVPFGIFGALLVLSLVLFANAVRSGGARHAFEAAGIGWNPTETWRFFTIAIILFFYIVGLVPRVDFILSSGLLITALIYGYHGGHPRRMALSATATALSGGYAMITHLPRAQWNEHGDDWVCLCVWLALLTWVIITGRRERITRFIPMIAILAPLILVCVMAFGFRQNVPNRGGLIFKQIEYHYFVTLKPLWTQQ